MPAYRNPTTLIAAGTPFTVSSKLVAQFPDARAFLTHLLGREVSPAVAIHYVKLVARLKHQQRLDDPDTIVHAPERTAANAYRRWRADTYAQHLKPVRAAFGRLMFSPDAITWLRRHALVAPYAGKTIPLKGLDTRGDFRPSITWQPCDTWTLHVPDKPCEPHVDPCETCAVLQLDAQQLDVIAKAFEGVWGHKDLAAVPPDVFLFGEAPAETLSVEQIEKSVTLVAPGALSNALSNVRSRVTRDVDSFLASFAEGAEGVYVSREACGDRLQEVLTAVWNTWRQSGPSAS